MSIEVVSFVLFDSEGRTDSVTQHSTTDEDRETYFPSAMPMIS